MKEVNKTNEAKKKENALLFGFLLQFECRNMVLLGLTILNMLIKL